MTTANNLTTQPIQPTPLAKPVLIGAGIALILIAAFLLKAGEPNPSWSKYWMIKPLILVPLAGATGGACYYFINRINYQSSWKKALAIVFSVVIYIIGLWIGTVLGLNGTYWD